MAGDGAFLVEEFLQAIASQLDRTQDALAFKAVNRPLTYAIKDFTLGLQVFVEMDGEGNVRFRHSGPNETGASTVHIGFTTITRPMIEENTVALSQTRAPSLADAGFGQAERQQLERLGVRNVAQLRRLGSSSGTAAVSRLTQIPVARLRAALQPGQPRVATVRAFPEKPAPVDDGATTVDQTIEPHPFVAPAPSLVERAAQPPRVIRLAPDSTHLHFSGTNLVSETGWPEARLNGEPVALSEADWDRIVIPVPAHLDSGVLELALPGGEVNRFQLIRESGNGTPTAAHAATEPWLPETE
jgi:hypothetical protein